MDIQTEKLHLIEELTKVQDTKLLAQIKELLKGANSTAHQMRSRAKESLADIAAGRVKSATIFNKEIELWKKKKRLSIK
jgi:hypothetical protein